MATTGTYAFNDPASGLTALSYGRIGIRTTEITAQHMADATTEWNLLQVELSNHQPNLWRTEVFPITLVAGTATYDLPARMIAIQDLYLSVTSGGTTTDRLLWPLSYMEYDAQANKTQQAPPTSYLANKTIAPTITFWQVPDASADYVANVRILTQMQDVSLKGGTTLDMPYRYLDAAVAGMSLRLARLYARDKLADCRLDFADALAAAQNTDTQDSVGLYIMPDFSGYRR